MLVGLPERWCIISRSVLPFLHGASRGVTSSRVLLHSTFSRSMPEHKLRCWSTTRMRGLPYDRNQLFLYAFLRVSPDWSRRGTTRCNPVPKHMIRTCLRKKVKSDNIVEHEGFAQRLTIASTTTVLGGCQNESALGSTKVPSHGFLVLFSLFLRHGSQIHQLGTHWLSQHW